MTWPNHIERWRQFVNWESKDIPTDLVLSIIDHESNGQAGAKAQRTCKPDEVPTDKGNIVTVSKALGLMQVIPSHVRAWNEHRSPKITLDDMTGDDERAARLQIRLGSSIFASYVQKLHEYDPSLFPGTSPSTATEEQLKLALVAYAIGPGKKGGDKGLIPKLEVLRARGQPLTLVSLQKSFPKWGFSENLGKWINRPLYYADRVWRQYVGHSTGAPSTAIIPSPQIAKRKLPIFQFENWITPGLLIALILYLTKSKLGSELLNLKPAKG